MPCCNITNITNPIFPPTLIPDAQRFAKYVGGAPLSPLPGGIGNPTPTTILISALHLEMKLWEPTKFNWYVNDAHRNSWGVMSNRTTAPESEFRRFNQRQQCDNLSAIVPPKPITECRLIQYDEWLLDNIIRLKSKGLLKAGIKTWIRVGNNKPPALATIGLAQKLINILLKYEISWQVAGRWNYAALAPYRIPLMRYLSQYLCALHAPIDRIFLDGSKNNNKPKTNFGLGGTPLGHWLTKKGLLNGANLKQSCDGNFRPWSKLDCLRTYYGLQLMLRRIVMETWPKGCACDDLDKAISRCADWFENEFGKDHACGNGQVDWIDAARKLPNNVITETIEKLIGAKHNTPTTNKSDEVENVINKPSPALKDKCFETKHGGNVNPIFLNEIDNNGIQHRHALRIVNSCDDRWNLGAICWKHYCLDLQNKKIRGGRYLIGEIAAQGGNFLHETPRCRIHGGIFHGRGHTPRVHCVTCCWGGSSYEAGVHFESIGAAVKYLKKYFDVRACAGNATYNQAWINTQ